MNAVGRLKNRRKKNQEDPEQRREFTVHDRELLSKDITYLLRELHDEAMNFKGVSFISTISLRIFQIPLIKILVIKI